MDINTCYETTRQYHTIAYYAHLVPVTLALFLSVYALIKTKFSRLAVSFFVFTVSFSLWLIADLILWTGQDYNLIYFFWSWLDLVNIVFFICGAYFFGILAREQITTFEKVILILLTIPALVVTGAGLSVVEFNQPVCEAANGDFLTYYKLASEGVVVLLMVVSLFIAWTRSDFQGRRQQVILLMALFAFFSVFAGTEYIASVSGVYEINLYGLFVLPLFLIVMTFAVTNLGVFNLRLIGTQIFSYVLIIMSGSQLLFISDSTQATLSIITLAISIIFGILLLQNAQKEEQARKRIETLAKQLEEANKQQVILIHFITHQIKGFVAKSRNIFAMIREGDYGPVPDTMKPMIEEGFRSDSQGAETIQNILNASNIKSGKVSYNMQPFDLKKLVDDIVATLKPLANGKGLDLLHDTGRESLTYIGDRVHLENAFKNLIDNSIKYTPTGSVKVILKKIGATVRLEIQDTGVGITPEDMQNLFTEGGHGKESQKVNVESTGFGLYIVKNIVVAHKGKVWAESDGAGNGSRFIVELSV